MDACRAVRARVHYTRDIRPEDRWQSSRQTWRRGAGDCEDFAACIVDMCREKGIQADTYVLWSADRRESHAVAMGTFRGQTWMSSNGGWEPVNSREAAAYKVARTHGWDPTRARIGRADLLYRARPDPATPSREQRGAVQ
jgi:hypothetical protein